MEKYLLSDIARKLLANISMVNTAFPGSHLLRKTFIVYELLNV